MKKSIIILAILAITSVFDLKAELCNDFMIWDGREKVRAYGVDSTGNWWAMTAPFDSFYRLIVNGDETDDFSFIHKPVFSQDGRHWAAFGEINGTWYVITEIDYIELRATNIGNLGYTNDSKHLVYSYFIGDIEYIVLPNRTIEVVGKTGTFFVNRNANMFAFTGNRGNSKVININGKESTTYDDILPIGFWHDNSFLYAAKNGNTWQIYRDERSISVNLNNVKETALNQSGTVAAAIVETTAGFQTAITISDDYYEPLFGRNYDLAAYLQIHPELALVSYVAKSGLTTLIVMNTAEYATYENTGVPYFTNDGEDLFYAACEFDCFVSVNGRRHLLKTTITPQMSFAMKSGSKSIAFATGSNMVVLFLETQKMHAGMMVDRIIPPVYNRRMNRYEAIGEINNRLYLLTCRVN